jgi:long-chain acyl-CoA synthetase
MTIAQPAPAANLGTGSSEPRPWLKSYPAGVPATINEKGIGTLADLFRDSVARYADRPALESFGKRQTYAELGEAANAVAAWLQTRGLNKGDRVAIMLPNVMAYPAILFGVLISGYTVVNVNPLYTARELAHQIKDSGARVLFVLENFGHTVEEALPNVDLDEVVVVTPGDLMGLKGMLVNLVSRHVKKAVKPFRMLGSATFASVIAANRGKTSKAVSITPDDIAFLQYTGGTTGVAKGAILRHRNVAANVEQVRVWLADYIGDRPDHVMVTALPLYHIFALTACGILMCRLGACQLLIANPRDIPGFIKTLKSRPFTLMSGVNTLYNALANNSGLKEVDFSQVRLCISGGMATQAPVAQRWREITGQNICEGYGLSETSPVVTANRLDVKEFTGSIGYPLPSTDVSIRSVDDGRILPVGEPGELCVKGPQVMAGYWNRPEETAKVTTGDGFFRTGDVAVLQADGSLKIVDRIKDMVLVSGFNVYPNEVEEVLAGHPGVLEAAVIGVPDEHSGEAVAAYIVKKDPNLTETDLRAFCKDRLTGYKIPRRVAFRDSLPKTPVGKVLRRELRDEVLGKAKTSS